MRSQFSDSSFRREEAAERFRLGRLAVKEGRLEEGREYLLKAVEIDREYSDAWLWLSATTRDPAEQKKYLEWALAANPANPEAKRGLAILQGRLNPKDLLPTGAEAQPRRPTEPEAAEAIHVFNCPQCGGLLRFDPESTDLKCEHCGQIVAVEESPVVGAGESLDLTLPTLKGRRWAEAERRLICQQCGGATIFPVGQTSAECPFCNSNMLIAASEAAELVAPQAIIPMAFDFDQAKKHVRNWLGRGFFIPDDLTQLARAGAVRPAYAPIWRFDVTLNGKWGAYVAEDHGGNRRWAWQTGEHIFIYAALIPGAKILPLDLWRKLEPFDLKQAVEYKPDYLAGWSTAAYTVSLAQASLEAREQLVQRARKELLSSAAPGRVVRDLQVSGVDFITINYQLALVPLWLATYTYRGQTYRILINGQTGKVVGDKPTDSIKVALVIATIAIALGLLVALFFLWRQLS